MAYLFFVGSYTYILYGIDKINGYTPRGSVAAESAV